MLLTSSRSAEAGSKRLLGKTVPRIHTKPLRELTPDTSLGFEAIEAAKIAGRRLHPWQEWFLIHSLELALGSFSYDEFPKLRFKTVLLLVSRQNGKSFIMSTRLLWRMLMWDGPEVESPLILGAAHKLSAAEEILDLTTMALRRSAARKYIAHKSNVNGNKYLELTNGSRYKCEAASDDGGRGLSVTDLAFDELRQQRDWESWSALTNTTNARYSSQTLAVSNAGTGKSDVLRGLRKQGLDRIADWEKYVDGGLMDAEAFANQHDTTLALFEWSAPDGCDIWDRDGWAQANPSMGHEDENGIALITEETLASKASLVGKPGEDGVPEYVFRTENLCQWVTADVEGPFPPEKIEACTDNLSVFADDSPLVLAVDTSHDRGKTYLAVAGYRPDGIPMVQVIAQRDGTEWVAKTVASGLDFTPDAVIVQGRGAPASSLIEYLRQEGVEVTECQGTDLTSSCSQFSDRVMNGSLRFTDQPALMLALKDAVKKDLGEVWVWNRAKSPVDVAPLCAVTEALWGLETLPSDDHTSAYEDHDLLVL
ncbi:terminase large subunit domain-containing protein [Arthrobacter sp. ERGS1:01]|uniref:terminase large subunit domain-containing protein n=1 Tax=Arthrobacter sp. ERGS1:01 TaxID=1704044 RepID=UPI000AF7AA19|nr:terminase large subunit [Arthrobacter sp. ERGS1:01]